MEGCKIDVPCGYELIRKLSLTQQFHAGQPAAQGVHEAFGSEGGAGFRRKSSSTKFNAGRISLVVIDLANSPSFEDKAVLEFFETSGRNLLAAEKVAGVGHHIAPSVVGAGRLPDSGYLRAKMAQERLIRSSGIPYTIVHSTQFFEFLGGIAQSATAGDTTKVSSAYFQPIASDDLADAMAEVALPKSANGVIEIGAPDRVRMSDLVARFLKMSGDPRKVIPDAHARYFGAELDDRSLVPGDSARLGGIADHGRAQRRAIRTLCLEDPFRNVVTGAGRRPPAACAGRVHAHHGASDQARSSTAPTLIGVTT
jgi:uncharacterized protein YbjT (DUF2867 family)